MYGMEKTIFYFFEPAKLPGTRTKTDAKEEVFMKHSFRERNKVLQGKIYGDEEKVVGFPVPEFRRKGEAWGSDTLSKLIDRTLKQYDDREPQILLQPKLGEILRNDSRETSYEREKGAVFQIGESLLADIANDRMSRFSMVVPGDDFFLLEEELFWTKDVLKDKLSFTKELSIFVMRAKGIPPVVYEFTDYLAWEYGIVCDVWDMNHFCIEELLHKKGLSLGNVPKVILDMDGKTRLPEVLCPAGSKYLDLFSSEETRQAYSRENSDIYYVSPCSLLDTIINNGYNIVVN